MAFNRQVSCALDDEHRAHLEFLGRVEAALGRKSWTSSAADAELAGLIARLARHLDDEIHRHFAFEERELFPLMAESGDGDMVELLAEEHEAIRAVTAEILPLAREVAAGTLSDAGWTTLKRGATELIERQVAHIQKETMALLPLLDDLLDEDRDRELAFAYAEA